MERELLLLGILRRQEMHGYQLAEFITHNLGVCTDLKKPTAYFLLDKMAKAGWVACEAGQSGKRPPHRTYCITAEGEQAFQRMLREQLAAYTSVYFGGDLPLAFMDALPGAEVLDLLRMRRASLLAVAEKAQAAPVHPGNAQYLVRHQVLHLRAELAWLDELLGELSDGVSPALNL